MSTIFWTDGAAVLVLLVQGLFAWALWSLRRSFVRSDEYFSYMNRTAGVQQDLKNRLCVLESRGRQLPDGEGLASFAAAVEDLRGDIKAVEVRISGVDRIMLRLERVLDRQESLLRSQQH